MKYFEVEYPYYALLQAENLEAAIKEYTTTVANDDGSLADSIKEVDSYYAILTYGKGLSEEGEEISVEDLVADLTDDSTKTLLIDGALL